MCLHYFYPFAFHGQPLALDPALLTSEPTVALNMGLSGLQIRPETFES